MKYYYDDPFEVFYMRRWYSMEIVSSVFMDGSFEGCIIQDLEGFGKWYIHQDCHDLLKPQVDDLVYVWNGRNWGHPKTVTEWQGGGFFLNVHKLTSDVLRNKKKMKIIRRNDRAFFMPKIQTEE